MDGMSHTPFENVEIRRLAGACGAEVLNIDLAGNLTQETYEFCNRVLLEHGVIFFRDQDLTPQQLLDFSGLWGEIHVHPHQPSLPGAPGVWELIKEADERMAIGDNWHSDQMFTAEPALGTILYAKEVPPYGGDTMFSNMYMAYDALSEGMKAMLAGVKTLNKYPFERARNKALRQDFKAEDIPTVEHPLFRRHPETGRTSLYFSYSGTTRGLAGMRDEESAPIRDYLTWHMGRPEFTCRFRWEKGSIAFWDNRCVNHCAVNDYHGFRRYMQRVTIKGDAVIAA